MIKAKKLKKYIGMKLDNLNVYNKDWTPFITDLETKEIVDFLLINNLDALINKHVYNEAENNNDPIVSVDFESKFFYSFFYTFKSIADANNTLEQYNDYSKGCCYRSRNIITLEVVNTSNIFDIYFYDLDEETQLRLLKFLNKEIADSTLTLNPLTTLRKL